MENKSLEQDYLNALKAIKEGYKGDLCELHIRADELIIRLLGDLKCFDIANLYAEMSKNFNYA